MGKMIKPFSMKCQIKRQSPNLPIPRREIPCCGMEGDICLCLWLSAKKLLLEFDS